MKNLVLLFLLIPLFTCSVFSQAFYLDTLRNAFALNAGVGFESETQVRTIGASYTLKGSFTIGLSYASAKLPYEGDDYTGNGITGYLSFTVASEARKNNVGVEVGIFFDDLNYTGNFEKDKIESSSYGVGLFFSKNLSLPEARNALLFQSGVTIIPSSEILVYDRSFLRERIVSPILVQFSLSPSIVFGRNMNTYIILEPAISHNFQYNITVFSAGLTMIF